MHKVRDLVFEIDKIEKKAIGYEIELGEKKLIVIKAKKGYIACGYIDQNISEKFGDAAVFVSGVSSIDDVLNANVKSLTTNAKALGINENDKIKDIMKYLL